MRRGGARSNILNGRWSLADPPFRAAEKGPETSSIKMAQSNTVFETKEVQYGPAEVIEETILGIVLLGGPFEATREEHG